MELKKVGIITFHGARNYGAVLQAYALQKKLSEHFPQTEIINYQNPGIARELRLWNNTWGGVKGFMRALLGAVFRFRKKSAFDAFLKHELVLSSAVDENTIKQYASKYDIVITGSDQIWNTELTAGDMHYFLSFCGNDQIKISYAASFGDKKIELSETVKKLLSEFTLITLREDTMLEEVKKTAMCPIGLACDPSLLLEASEWKRMCSERLLNKKYVFLFMIDDSKELRKYAQEYAEKNQLILVSNKNDFHFFCHPSPKDFLSWILYADHIFTNSFHGTVFSILFHKKFVSHLKNNKGMPKKRIILLLEQLGLSYRNTDNAQFDIEQDENWEYIDEKLRQIKSESWKHITDQFEKIQE